MGDINIFILLAFVVFLVLTGVMLWIALRVKQGLIARERKEGEDSSDREEAFRLIKTETERLRLEMTEAMSNNNTLINQQLMQVTSQVSEQLKSVNSQLQTSSGQISDRMDNAARVIGEVKQNLGELGKSAEQIFAVGKDISSLQQILKAPKLRGELGEFFLGDLLSQILPSKNFELQYGFKSGVRVDAVIKLSQGIVPVDSKFPLENFRRIIESHTEEEKRSAKRKFIKDVKGRIDEIASAYILPDEGTFNFALMYIPAENVYYETIIKDEDFGDDNVLSSYAFAKRVIPVSPNSFYAYLQTILLGLRGLEISKEAESILSNINALTNDFERFRGDFDVLGKHIGNTRNKYEETQKRVDRFGEKLDSIAAKDKGELGDGDDDASDSDNVQSILGAENK
jgi:DNA recombination protein RmuC